VNAPAVIDYLESGMSLGDMRRLDQDQLVRFQQSLYHWYQLAARELRERARISKEEQPE
jgi:hypothetical protein